MKRFITILIGILFVAAPSWGKEWTLDPNHSFIRFGVTHIFSTVGGTFSDFEGKVEFDPADLDKSRFDFTVRVKSIDTGNTKRDNHLRSKDFFDASAWPVMTFVSSKITKGQGNAYVAVGTMTLKETSQTIEIPFEFHGPIPNPFDKTQVIAGFDSQFDIDRLGFGVGDGKFHKMGIVGRTVAVKISLEAFGTP